MRAWRKGRAGPGARGDGRVVFSGAASVGLEGWVEAFVLTIGDRVCFPMLGTQAQFVETKWEFICGHLRCAGGSRGAPGIGAERGRRCLALRQTSC